MDAQRTEYTTKQAYSFGVEHTRELDVYKRQGTFSTAYSVINNLTGGKLESIRSTISNKIQAAKDTVSSVLDSIKSAFSSKLEAARSVVSSTCLLYTSCGV